MISFGWKVENRSRITEFRGPLAETLRHVTSHDTLSVTMLDPFFRSKLYLLGTQQTRIILDRWLFYWIYKRQREHRSFIEVSNLRADLTRFSRALITGACLTTCQFWNVLLEGGLVSFAMCFITSPFCLIFLPIGKIVN